jgi:catechol 2,3-dioxygenase
MAPIDSQARIGHVHLRAADLERSLDFELAQRMGDHAAFVSAGGYRHHIGLNTWESLGGTPPAPGTTGLYHLAVVYPSRQVLADALRRLLGAGIELDGAADHGVSEALYLRDPDQNGFELYWDRPREHWPHDASGALAMFTRRLDLESLLREEASFLVGYLRGESILRLAMDGRRVVSQERLLEKGYGRIREVTEAPDGSIYFSTSQHDPPEGRPAPNTTKFCDSSQFGRRLSRRAARIPGPGRGGRGPRRAARWRRRRSAPARTAWRPLPWPPAEPGRG